MKPPLVEGDGVQCTLAAACPCTSKLRTECFFALQQEQVLARERNLVNGLRNVFVIHRRSQVPRGFGTRLAQLTAALGGAAGRACGIAHQMVPLALLQTDVKYLDVHSVSWHRGHAFRLGYNTTGWSPAQHCAQQRPLGLERHPHQPAFDGELVPFHSIDDMKTFSGSKHSSPREYRWRYSMEKVFLVSLACVIVVENLMLDFPKNFPNGKMSKVEDKEHHEQDQSQNRCAILPSQSIVSEEGLQIDK